MNKPLDEMERNIKLKAKSFAHTLTKILLGVWSLFESYKTLTSGGPYYILPFSIFFISHLGEGFYEFMLKRKMIAGDNEYKEPSKVTKTLIAVITAAVILAAVCAYISFALVFTQVEI